MKDFKTAAANNMQCGQKLAKTLSAAPHPFNYKDGAAQLLFYMRRDIFMHEGHRQRLLNRYLNEGLSSFEDHEVLELLLFYAIPRRDTNAIAHRLIDSFGSISKVFETDAKSLMQVEGVGKYAACYLSLIFEASKRYKTDAKRERIRISTIEEAGKYATELFIGIPVEKVYLICLDMRSRVIHNALISEGTIDETPIYPRKIVAEALKNNAAKVILAHNHPGGSPKPSAKDLEATSHAIDVLKKIDIDLLDHIIVGQESYISLAAQRFIERDGARDLAYAAQYEKKQ
jgi:DNA repair protein RadC